MKSVLLMLLSVIVGFGAITNVKVVSTTNTQAIMSWSAPDASCSIEVSESATYTPLVHDIDPTLFSNANVDASRSTGQVIGTYHTIVIGTRRAERALDGSYPSRALQAATTHYYRITCGASTATGQFTTDTLANGNTYSETYPVDPVVQTLTYVPLLGSYGWPEFKSYDINDATARPEVVVDPFTGVALKRITMPRDFPNNNSPTGDHNFDAARGTNWTNAGSVLVDDTASATYSGSTRDWLFLQMNIPMDNPRDPGSDGGVLDYITASLKAWCSGGTCGSSQNNVLQVCLTINEINCWPSDATAKIQEVTLGTSALPSTFVVAGTTTPILDSWHPAGYQMLSRLDLGARAGTSTPPFAASRVDVAVDGTVTRANNWTPFSMAWIPGTHVTVNGQLCTLTQGGNRNTIKIDTASCTLSLPLSGVTLEGGTIGFLVRKKTTSTDTINIQYGKYTVAYSFTAGMPSSGSSKLSNDTPQTNTVTGRTGYQVSIVDSGHNQMYWVDDTTGDANFVGQKTTDFVGGANGWDVGYGVTAGNGNLFYAVVQDHSGRWIPLQCTATTTNQPNSLSTGCTSMVSAGDDLGNMVAAFTAGDTPSLNTSQFVGWGVIGVQVNGGDNHLFIGSVRSQQDTAGFAAVFDPQATGTPGGRCSSTGTGCIIAAQSTYGHFPARWCSMHTEFATFSGTMVWRAGKFMTNNGSLGGGPFQVTITGTRLTSTPVIAAGTGNCPAGSNGCDNIVVSGEPVNAGTADATLSGGILQPAASGDHISINGELMGILNKVDSTHWFIQRAIDTHSPVDHSGDTVISMWCSAPSGIYDSSGSWVAWDPLGTSNWSFTWDYAADPHGQGVTYTPNTKLPVARANAGTMIAPNFDHPAPRADQTVGQSTVPSCAASPLECYQIMDGVAPNHSPTKIILSDTKWAGTLNCFSATLCEDHPGRNNLTGSWLMDGRPFTPNPERQVTGTASVVGGQLYKFTSTTSNGDDLTQIGGSGVIMSVNRKIAAQNAYCSGQPLIDISSSATGNQIATNNTTPYTYCISRKANECRTGAAVGDVYMNCPIATPRFGDGTYGGDPAVSAGEVNGSLIIFNQGGYNGGVQQSGYTTDDLTGKLGRMVTHAMARHAAPDGYWTANALPNGKFAMVRSLWSSGLIPTVMAVKLPPIPGVDSIDRTTFVPVTVSATPPVGSAATSLTVNIGYFENGTPDQYYCRSRRESCVVTSATVNQSNPFTWASDVVSGISCSSGCTVALPGISQHILYYQFVWRDAGFAVVRTSQRMMVAVP